MTWCQGEPGCVSQGRQKIALDLDLGRSSSNNGLFEAITTTIHRQRLRDMNSPPLEAVTESQMSPGDRVFSVVGLDCTKLTTLPSDWT